MVGVVDGEKKVAFLCASIVIIVAVVFTIASESLLEGVGPSGWGTGVRVEDTALSSAGLGAGVIEELAVEDSVASRDIGWSIGESCLDDKSGNGLKDLTEVGVTLINGAGGQSRSGPSWGILSLFAPLSLFLRDPSLNLLKRKALIVPMARAGTRRRSSQDPVEWNSRGKAQGCRQGGRRRQDGGAPSPGRQP